MLPIGNSSDKTDKAVVFAVGFHVPGMRRIIQGSVVRMVGVREHGMGFFRVAAAWGGVLGTDEGVFPGGGHQGVQKFEALGRLQRSHVFRREAGFGPELGRELLDGSHIGVEVGSPFRLEFLG